MTLNEFQFQLARLAGTYGKQHFSAEREKLIWRGVSDLPIGTFASMVDKFIRTSRSAPLPQDIIDLANQERKANFTKDVYGASKVTSGQTTPDGLRKFLDKRFGKGCSGLAEAIEIRKLQIRARKAEDPNYDPMTDPEWQ